MNNAVKNCKTSEEIFRAVNLYFNKNNINTKWSQILQKRLKEEKKFEKSLQMVFDYILNSEHPMKKDKYGRGKVKLSAIHGMECSNSYR